MRLRLSKTPEPETREWLVNRGLRTTSPNVWELPESWSTHCLEDVILRLHKEGIQCAAIPA